MSGRPEKRRHDDDKTPEKKHRDNKITDYGETECTICRGDFEEGDALKQLNCGHKFHEQCADAWLGSRRLQAPTCPTCSKPVDKSLLPRAPVFLPPLLSQEQTAREEAQVDTTNVLEQDDYDVPLFFGAVVCLKNARNGTKEIIGKYFNTDLDLDINSRIGDLRTAVLNKLRERPYKINKIYFGTPATCDENPDLVQQLRPSQSNRTLIDVYTEYYTKLHQRIIDVEEQRKNYIYEWKPSDEHIENLYYLHEINVDGQNIQTEYLYNPDNPDVPDEYIVHPSRIDERYPESVVYALQPIEVRRKSTYQRIAWIVFELEHRGTPGGSSSTHKKRRTNKKKSRKHKK